jgi:2-methylcitrate dehydratase PrpD
MRIIEELSGYIAAACAREIPAEVVEKSRHHILDTIAAMVSGSSLAAGRRAVAYARSQRGAREATVVATKLRAPAAVAALANGMMAHADETDDTHWEARLHPGCAVVPAALATAETMRRSGAELIRAVALGYDVGCRTIRALGGRDLGSRSTYGIGGTFGAAAAAAALSRLAPAQVAWSLSYAAQQASGILSWVADRDHVEKAFDFGGMPARNGVTAAVLVRLGFTGVDDVLEGEKNFLSAFSPHPRPERLVEGLGERFEILATSLKRFPAGAPIQAAAEALLKILERERPAPASVEKVVARLPRYGVEVVDRRLMPDVNLQYILAVTLLDGGLGFAAAHDARRMAEARTREMMERVELLADEELTRAEIPRQAIVEVILSDGRRLREHVGWARGTPGNPMGAGEVRQKALELIAPVLGESRAREVCETVERLEGLSDARELGARLRGG